MRSWGWRGGISASHASSFLVDIPSDNLAAVFRVMLASLKLLQDAVQEIEQVQGWAYQQWAGPY